MQFCRDVFFFHHGLYISYNIGTCYKFINNYVLLASDDYAPLFNKLNSIIVPIIQEIKYVQEQAGFN